MLRRLGAALVVLVLACGYALAASSKLSSLSAGTTITDGDLFYDVQNAGSGGVKITASQLATYMAAKGLGLVHQTTVLLSASQIANAGFTSSPVQIIPAQGANTAIIVNSVTYAWIFNTTAFTASSGAFGGLMACSSPVSYANCNGLDGGDTSCPTLGASSLCFSLSELNDVTNPVADYANLPVYYAVGATGGTGGYSGGDGTMKITVFWSTVPTQ
jgi:hypothetical protein